MALVRSHSNRLRTVLIDEASILNVMNAWMTPSFLALPKLAVEGLPEGCTIERCWHDQLRRAFVFVVSHASFEEVPDGQQIPTLFEEERIYQVRIEKRYLVPLTDEKYAYREPIFRDQATEAYRIMQEQKYSPEWDEEKGWFLWIANEATGERKLLSHYSCPFALLIDAYKWARDNQWDEERQVRPLRRIMTDKEE